MEIIQEINGSNNSLSVIKKHLSSPYPFKTNMQVWVHLAEHEFYKRQSMYRYKQVSSFTYPSPIEFFTGYGPWGM